MGDPFNSHDAILRLVAIAEDFSFGRLADKTEHLLPVHHLVDLLWDSELDRSGDTWHGRLGLWQRLYGVNVRDTFPSYSALAGFIEARNAITHGLGELTRRQRGARERTRQRLRQAGVGVQHDAVVVLEEQVEFCAQVVREFIVWLDARSG